KRIAPALRVARRQDRESALLFGILTRIAHEHGRAFAPADPELIGALRIEHHALRGAVDLEPQAILAACGNLAHGQRGEHAAFGARHEARVVFGVDDLVDRAVAARLECDAADGGGALLDRAAE